MRLAAFDRGGDRGSADCGFRGGDHAARPPAGLPRRPGLRRRAPAGRRRAVAPAVDQADPSQEDRSRAVGSTGRARVAGVSGGRADHSREPQRLPAVVLPRGGAGDQHPGRGTDHRPAQARAQQAIHGLRGRLAPRRDQLDDRDDGRAGNPGRTGRAGPGRALPRGRFLLQDATRLEADRAVLPRPAAGNRRAGRRSAAALLARLRFTDRRRGRPRSWPRTRPSGCWDVTAGSHCQSTR